MAASSCSFGWGSSTMMILSPLAKVINSVLLCEFCPSQIKSWSRSGPKLGRNVWVNQSFKIPSFVHSLSDKEKLAPLRGDWLSTDSRSYLCSFFSVLLLEISDVPAFPSALPQAITIIISRESDAFPWTTLDHFLATTLSGLCVMFIPVSFIFHILDGLSIILASSITFFNAEKNFDILIRAMAWCLEDSVASGVFKENDGLRDFNLLHHICDGTLFLNDFTRLAASMLAYFRRVLFVRPTPCSVRCSAVLRRSCPSSLLSNGFFSQITPCSIFPVTRSESVNLE